MHGGSMGGRTCVVTGATSGIGEQIALGLARLGARVIAVGRSRERGEAALERLRSASGNPQVELALADLSSQREIRDLAGQLLERCPALHVLVNNAGIANARRELTADGLEATFAVNHLAYFQLTQLLLPRLRESAPARIVNVSSEAHRFARLDFSDLQSERRYGGLRAYGRSKTANLLFTIEQARRLQGTGVTINAAHPGAVATRLGQQNGRLARALLTLLAVFMSTPAQGADTPLWLACEPALAGVTGAYFARRTPRVPAAHARDPGAARQLFEQSAKLMGDRPVSGS